jgi:hypothetical protein
VSGPDDADVFEGTSSTPIAYVSLSPWKLHPSRTVDVEFGGPFSFYRDFWRTHELQSLEALRPEIAVQPGDMLTIPIAIRNSTSAPVEVSISAEMPSGWGSGSPIPTTSVSAQSQSTVLVRATAPAQLSSNFAEIKIRAAEQGNILFQNSIFVQVSAYVAGQVK